MVQHVTRSPLLLAGFFLVGAAVWLESTAASAQSCPINAYAGLPSFGPPGSTPATPPEPITVNPASPLQSTSASASNIALGVQNGNGSFICLTGVSNSCTAPQATTMATLQAPLVTFGDYVAGASSLDAFILNVKTGGVVYHLPNRHSGAPIAVSNQLNTVIVPVGSGSQQVYHFVTIGFNDTFSTMQLPMPVNNAGGATSGPIITHGGRFFHVFQDGVINKYDVAQAVVVSGLTPPGGFSWSGSILGIQLLQSGNAQADLCFWGNVDLGTALAIGCITDLLNNTGWSSKQNDADLGVHSVSAGNGFVAFNLRDVAAQFSRVMVFDAAGRRVWSRQRRFSDRYNIPTIVQPTSGLAGFLVFANGTLLLVNISSASTQTVWSTSTAATDCQNTPLQIGSTIYCQGPSSIALVSADTGASSCAIDVNSYKQATYINGAYLVADHQNMLYLFYQPNPESATTDKGKVAAAVIVTLLVVGIGAGAAVYFIRQRRRRSLGDYASLS